MPTISQERLDELTLIAIRKDEFNVFVGKEQIAIVHFECDTDADRSFLLDYVVFDYYDHASIVNVTEIIKTTSVCNVNVTVVKAESFLQQTAQIDEVSELAGLTEKIKKYLDASSNIVDLNRNCNDQQLQKLSEEFKVFVSDNETPTYITNCRNLSFITEGSVRLQNDEIRVFLNKNPFTDVDFKSIEDYKSWATNLINQEDADTKDVSLAALDKFSSTKLGFINGVVVSYETVNNKYNTSYLNSLYIDSNTHSSDQIKGLTPTSFDESYVFNNVVVRGFDIYVVGSDTYDIEDMRKAFRATGFDSSEYIKVSEQNKEYEDLLRSFDLQAALNRQSTLQFKQIQLARTTSRIKSLSESQKAFMDELNKYSIKYAETLKKLEDVNIDLRAYELADSELRDKDFNNLIQLVTETEYYSCHWLDPVNQSFVIEFKGVLMEGNNKNYGVYYKLPEYIYAVCDFKKNTVYCGFFSDDPYVRQGYDNVLTAHPHAIYTNNISVDSIKVPHKQNKQLTLRRFCFGNYEELISKNLAVYNLSTVAGLFVTFIKSYNETDPAGKLYHNWQQC